MRQFRFVHIGVALALAAGAAASVGLVRQAGAAGEGSASVFIPIVPCRLADTRTGSDNVGGRTTPIGSAESVTFAVWGMNGNCIIPSTATGIASNVTALNATASSYVTVYPADASPRPTASNLNFGAGSLPAPNQVTVGLSAAGAISAYNLTGSVDLIVDIVGYYAAAGAGSGTQGPPGPAGPACPTSGCQVSYTGYSSVIASGNAEYDLNSGCVRFDGQAEVALDLPLPIGAKITAVDVKYSDGGANALTVYLDVILAAGAATVHVNQNAFTSVNNNVVGSIDLPTTPPDPVEEFATPYLSVSGDGDFLRFCGAVLTYTF
jgi:hypothetical protein